MDTDRDMDVDVDMGRSRDVLLRRRFVRRRFVKRRRFVTETFCYGDVLLGDVLSRRRFVRRRFVCASTHSVRVMMEAWIFVAALSRAGKRRKEIKLIRQINRIVKAVKEKRTKL
jgi:hypothetical protein